MTEVASQNPALDDLVSDQRRRYVLRCLTGRNEGLALADLAADVAALERDGNPHEVPPAVVERVYVSLYHCHVPKLEDGDVVTHDRATNVVSLADENAEAEHVRRAVRQSAIRRRA